MASRGNIPQLMKMAGIEMMDPAPAAALVREVLMQQVQRRNGRSRIFRCP